MSYKTIFAKKLSCRIAGCLLAALLAASTLTYSQTAAVNPVVPNIVNYSGALTDASGKPLTAISGVTFSLYKDSEGGAPLWLETQNIQPDSRGHFSVFSEVPETIFTRNGSQFTPAESEITSDSIYQFFPDARFGLSTPAIPVAKSLSHPQTRGSPLRRRSQ